MHVLLSHCSPANNNLKEKIKRVINVYWYSRRQPRYCIPQCPEQTHPACMYCNVFVHYVTCCALLFHPVVICFIVFFSSPKKLSQLSDYRPRGGTATSWLVCSTPAVRVWALAGVFCCVLGQDTLLSQCLLTTWLMRASEISQSQTANFM